jgi:hypothetical protein
MVFASSQHQFVFSPLRWGGIHAHAPYITTKYANVISSHANEDTHILSENMHCHSLKQIKRQRSTLVLWHSLWKRVRTDLRASLSNSHQDWDEDEDEDDILENIPTCYDIPVDTGLHFYLRHQSQQSAKLATSLSNIVSMNVPVVPFKPFDSSKEEYTAASSTICKLQDSNRPLREMLHIKQVLRMLHEKKDQSIALREMEWYNIQMLEMDLCGVRAMAIPKRNIYSASDETTRRPSYVEQTMVTTLERGTNFPTASALSNVLKKIE